MASPFDQYEQASMRSKILPNADIRPEAVSITFSYVCIIGLSNLSFTHANFSYPITVSSEKPYSVFRAQLASFI